MPVFGSPWFLLLLPAVALAGWRVFGRRPRRGLLFPALARVPARGMTWRAALANAGAAAVLAGAALAVVALARPRAVLSRSQRTAAAIAIQMVVDVSGSMNALDMSERTATGAVRERTRLDAVKEMFIEFLSRRPDDLIGLVTFGGYASTRSPLTPDHRGLEQLLRGVEIPQPELDGQGQVADPSELMTAIGDGLASATARLRDAETRSRIIVLLSDGESNTGLIRPEQAAEAAGKLGVRIYCIGVGSTGVAPVRVKDRFGRDAVQYQQFRLDEGLLRKMAADTGGRYFNVRDARGLRAALADIDKLERTEVRRDVYQRYREWFPWLLAPAAALLAAGFSARMFAARRMV
jgi:Ca-activated chloride channel family protein